MTDLTDTLRRHREWLTYLSGADLTRADLAGAYLTRANLTRANLGGANLTGADLSGADLSGADLSGADLTGADLTGADLSGADLSDVNLSCSSGVLWAQTGPIGTDRRIVTGVWQDNQVTLHAGCFHGTRAEWDHTIANSVADPASSPWEWPDKDPDELDRLAVECTDAADRIQASIHTQLASLETP